MTSLTSPSPALKTSLYERDFLEWIETTADLLRSQKFSEVDLENLIEEIECMGRNEKRALTSNLRVVLLHLLKYKYQSEKRSNSWLYTIREHRIRLIDAFSYSPSLRPYFLEIFTDCYQDARALAADETGLPIFTFLESSPFTPEQILDTDFLP